MWDLKACVVCFNVDGKLFKINSAQLRNDFYLVSGIKSTENDGLPQYLCVECSAYVRRFKKFRDKCKRAHFTLKEIIKQNREIKITDLEAIDRKLLGVAPELSFTLPERAHYEEVSFKWVKHNRLNVTESMKLPIIYHSTLPYENDFKVPKKKPKLTNCESENSVKVETDDSFIDLDEEFSIDDNKDSVLDQSTSNVNNSVDTENIFDNEFQSDYECDGDDAIECKTEDKDDTNVDGTNLDEEYASMIPISEKEAKAAVEVYKMFTMGTIKCEICGKSFYNKKRHQMHLRMHDKHVSGTYFCTLCHYYYKTEFLLKTHQTEKHMFKYVCRKCPEVTFDRISAKQHFIWTHLQKCNRKTHDTSWYDARPSWLSKKGGKRVKGVVSLRPVSRFKKLPDDFPIYSPIGQKEQYEMIQDRKKSRNYKEALFKCELCFRGFREAGTYGKHMKKHDPEISGNSQCDMCKLYFRDARKVYKHMIITHLFKYSCQFCSYVVCNRGQAHTHYKWHKNVVYPCPICKKEFKKLSTRLTHIRIKHPSNFICNLCGHSFVSETGLYFHKKLAHTKEEIEAADSTPLDKEDPRYCEDCKVQFISTAAYKIHLGSSNKHVTINKSVTNSMRVARRAGRAEGERKTRGRPRCGESDIVNNGVATSTECEVCGKFLSNDVQARKHYDSEHPGTDYLKRYMCDVCGHTTRQYANLMVHMRTHTNEKPYGCPHCDRRFSMPSNRDRHLVVHTGEKRYQCQHCNRRFTQSSAVKLHIQTVHLKIPYAPWDKKNRKRRKELEGASVSVGTMLDTTASCLPAQPKVLLDQQGDYLNAYITYNDE